MVFKFFTFLLILINTAHACKLNQKIISLSGPVTMTLEELNLLGDKSLVAISNFHPVSSSIKVKRLMGGLFLSAKELLPFKETFIFFDKSQDLKKVLKHAGIKSISEIDSRAKDSFQVSEEVLKNLSPKLTGCEERVGKIRAKLANAKKKIMETSKRKILFFLGAVGEKLPDLLIAKDGFVLSLMKYAKLDTFNSELSYVVWSRKELRKYNDYLKVGISKHKASSNKLVVEKLDEENINISYRGSLIPGISQVNFLVALQDSILFKEKQE